MSQANFDKYFNYAYIKGVPFSSQKKYWKMNSNAEILLMN